MRPAQQEKLKFEFGVWELEALRVRISGFWAVLIFCDIARNHGTPTGMLLNYSCPMFEAGSARGCWISVYGSGFQALGFRV